MAKYVTLSAIGANQFVFEGAAKNFAACEKAVKEHLKARIEEVLPDKPDLIVFPECANRYAPHTRPELKAYYQYLGDSIVDFLKPIAKENNTNIAYSAVRFVPHAEDKPFRNSTVYIDRMGEVCGVYDKNHLMVEENTESDIQYGKEAKLVSLDFGKAASAICFDLNFDELLYQYRQQRPDIIVFSSMFHGGIMRQAQWAYTCRSYFVGAICGQPCYILNPYGEIIAGSTNYTKHVSAAVNLDYALCHFDYNQEKLIAAKRKYKDALDVHDPGFVGSVLLSCNDPDMTVRDMIAEFEIEVLDDYLERARAHRRANL